MNTVLVNELKSRFYSDSVTLMRISREIRGEPGVIEAALMIGTPANKSILEHAGLLNGTGAEAGSNDLVIAVRASSEDAGRSAAKNALTRLSRRPSVATDVVQGAAIRSLRAAFDKLPDASVAIISVPGEFAAAEARKAIRSGLDVMIFSNNVSIDDEKALKSEAYERGRLVMGPDCGTAIINGVPLAFGNKVPRGNIGIVGASGTGIQEIACLIAQSGAGISQAIGVGGRDLSERVGALSTLTAIDILDSDPETHHVVVASKPPDPEVARIVLCQISRSAKRFTICFLGAERIEAPSNAAVAETLTAAAESAIGSQIVEKPFDFNLLHPKPGSIVGLYSGGTLCSEAQLVLKQAGRTVCSNSPVRGALTLSAADSGADQLIDFGAEEYTVGRPHPMIDPTARQQPLANALTDPTVAVVLFDVVIGYGAHADPAGAVASYILQTENRRAYVVASVTGTDQDPQVRSRQIAKLERAGVLVTSSNAYAAKLAASLSNG
jgi:FdrA protein